MRLTIAYFKIKKRNLVLINNVTHQRETLTEWPIRLPLKKWSIDSLLQRLTRRSTLKCVKEMFFSPLEFHSFAIFDILERREYGYCIVTVFPKNFQLPTSSISNSYTEDFISNIPKIDFNSNTGNLLQKSIFQLGILCHHRWGWHRKS